MASHRYQQLPTTEEQEESASHQLPAYTPPHSQSPLQTTQTQTPNQYFSGLPTSAPPSFYSTQVAATLPPIVEIQTVDSEEAAAVVDDGVSVWVPSEVNANSNARSASEIEDAMVRLMDRMEVLEGRLGVGLDLDLESGGAHKEQTSALAGGKWTGEQIWVILAAVWFCGTLTWVLVK